VRRKWTPKVNVTKVIEAKVITRVGRSHKVSCLVTRFVASGAVCYPKKVVQVLELYDQELNE
jgi:putative transposon-encoded protein